MPIDFVLLWVDGQDETWLKEKNKYAIHDDT
ncbi:Stealth CR1 domain-containing protein, partial [Leuconostoc falkenbergense]